MYIKLIKSESSFYSFLQLNKVLVEYDLFFCLKVGFENLKVFFYSFDGISRSKIKNLFVFLFNLEFFSMFFCLVSHKFIYKSKLQKKVVLFKFLCDLSFDYFFFFFYFTFKLLRKKTPFIKARGLPVFTSNLSFFSFTSFFIKKIFKFSLSTKKIFGKFEFNFFFSKKFCKKLLNL